MRRNEKIRKFLEGHPRATERDLQNKFALTRKEAQTWLTGETDTVSGGPSRPSRWRSVAGIIRNIFLSEKKFLFSLVALSVTIRLAYVSFLIRNESLRLPILDAEYYLEWAKEIANHGWLGSKIFFTEPLYAYFLAIFSKLFGESFLLTAALGFQFLLGAFFPVLLFWVGKRMLTERIGMIAGLIAALYGPFVFYEGLLLKTSFEVYSLPLFLLALFVTLERPNYRNLFLIGILLGFLGLIKGNTMIFVPVVLALIFFFHRTKARMEKILLSACFVGGIVLCILPVTIRNYVVGQDIVPTNYSIGLVLYQGSWWGGDGSTARVPDFLRPHPRFEESDAVGMAEAYVGKSLLPSEVSRFWIGKMLSEVISAPGHFLSTLIHKVALIVNYREYSDNYSYAFYRSEIPFLFVLPGYFLVIILGGAGLAALFSRTFERVLIGEKDQESLLRFRRARLVLVLCFSAYVLVLLLTTINSRYRMPLAPFLILFSASGIVFLREQFRERSWEGTRKMIVVGGLVFLLAILPLAIFKHLSLADAYQNIGSWYLKHGDTGKAEAYFRKAITDDDEYAWAYQNLAHITLRQGNYDEAESFTRRLIMIRPDDLSNYAVVRILKKMQALPAEEAQVELDRFLAEREEPAKYDPDFFEASRFLESGDDARAEELLLRSLERRENAVHTLIALASLRSKQDDAFAAKRYLRQALEENSYLFPARYNLANIFIRENEYREVVDLLEPVYQFSPELGEVWYNYAVALIKTGKTAEATPVVQGYIERYKGDMSRAEKVKKFEEALKPKDQSLDNMVKNLKK
ncbi:MAG: Tetratricopeptide repeat protein [Patescibacteria group bacterium]|nr:Tetratricopeptide repeat protein [Patescibacteria group bacterium]